MPLAAGRTNSPYVEAFFENLLPEGELRNGISMRERVTSVFGLLAKVGGDSAGSYILVPAGEGPLPPIDQPLSWEQVDLLVHDSGDKSAEREQIERAASNLPPRRLSISGAQYKVLLYIDEHGNPSRPMGNCPSTHIFVGERNDRHARGG